MGRAIKNIEAKAIINDCKSELQALSKIIINKQSKFSPEVPFLCRYSIIISAGTLEKAFKIIISDACEAGASTQLKNYLNKNFRSKPTNLKYNELCNSLMSFDPTWNALFKEKLKSLKDGMKWKSELDSLIDLRNDFAHGGKPTPTIKDIINYFHGGVMMLIIMEDAIK